MTALVILRANGAGAPQIVRDPDAIRRHLATAEVEYERWPTGDALPADASQDQVLAHHADAIRRLDARFGFTAIDVVAMRPDHPERAGARAKFLREHTHADFEVRFFVAGCGTFYLRPGDDVLAMVCTAGDLISVPPGLRHWFDMGTAPSFRCIRFFTTKDGWVGNFTGDEIAARLPDADRLAGLIR
jgi:1,2-dihydroxy-3-keto-5-methylthiopentene dioxygenase